MKKSILFLACLFTLVISRAQTDSSSVKKQRPYVVSIRSTGNRLIKGELLSVSDSQLVLKSFNGMQSIPSEEIRSFTLKRKNSVLKGALIGLGVGTATGIIIGLASGSDPVMSNPDPNEDPFGLNTLFVGINNAFAMTAGQKAVAGGLALGATGAIIGTLVGVLAHKTFIIGGRKQKLHDLQGEIMMKLIRK